MLLEPEGRRSMSHDHHHPNRKAQITRLRKISGQLKGIERMIEEEKNCVEVLTQLHASKKAIQSLSEKIMEEHLVHCVEHADKESGQKMIKEMVDILKKFVK